MQIYNSGAIVTGALCVAFLLPSAGQAQEEQSEADEAAVEEIIVTARRRDESLQNVPISIVARTGEFLERAGVNSVTELERVVAGIVFDNVEEGGQSTVSIRGLSTFSQELASSQSVGILIDDVVVDTIGQSVTDFNDVERIEVLRGPQGTLFGRNTTGGVIHIITKDPIDEFEAKASMAYGSYDEVAWNATANVPIGDTVAARASVFATSREGHIENINDGRMLGGDQQSGARAKLLFAPREGTRFKLTGTYLERKQDSSAGGTAGNPVVGFGPATSQVIRDVNADIAGPENDKVNGRGMHSFKDRIGAASLIWEEDIGEFELKSITAFESWQWDFGQDALFRSFEDPVGPLANHKFFLGFESTGWSQELRLTSPTGQRLEYVVGAFVSGSDMTEERDFLFNVSDDLDLANAIFVADQTVQDSELLNYAVFGEADFRLTDTLTLTAGVRWTHDETDVTVDATPVPGFIPELGIGFDDQGRLYIPILSAPFGFQEESVSANEWTWRGGARWQPTQELMFYGSVARGFKGPTVTALGLAGKVDPEFVTSYELGVKAQFLDNRLTSNLTVFHADITDFQAEGTQIIELAGENVTFFRLTNAAKARNQGVEFELSTTLTDQLILDMGLAYIDAEFDSYPDAACYGSQTEAEGCITDPDTGFTTQDLSGKKLPRIAPWSGNASLTYDFTLPFRSLDGLFRVDYSYRDRIQWSNGIAPLNESEAVGILGITLSLSTSDDQYEVVGHVQNLTDEYVVSSLFGGNGATRARLGPEYQRTWGITFNYRFQ